MRVRRLGLVIAVVTLGLLAQASVASAFRGYNTMAVAIPNSGAVTPVPSVQMRAPGTISSVYVSINGLSHTHAGDIDIAIESPSGKFVVLMSDSCGAEDLNSVGYEFNPDPFWPLFPQASGCSSGVYQPVNYGVGADTFSTAPGAIFSSDLSAFIGDDPNGLWKLHIEDDSGGDSGSLASWSVGVETNVDPALGYTRVPATGTGGTSESAIAIAKDVKLPRAIADVDVVLNDFSHGFPEDLNVLLVSPAGTAVVLMSDSCGGASLLRSNLRFDDSAPTTLPDATVPAECQQSSATVKPFDAEELETVLKGAPNGPYSPALSAFNGQSANGTWRLFLLDDQSGSEGYLKDFELAITQVPTKSMKPGRAALKFKKSGSSKILVSGRVPLTGPVVSAAECSGSFRSSLQTKKTRKKGKKRVTTYSRVASVRSKLRLVKGKCGVNVSAKLPKKFAGNKLRLFLNYRGGDYLSPFDGKSTIKIKRVKFS